MSPSPKEFFLLQSSRPWNAVKNRRLSLFTFCLLTTTQIPHRPLSPSLANGKCGCNAYVVAKSSMASYALFTCPNGKLFSRSGAPLRLSLEQRLVEPRHWIPWVPPPRWILRTGQGTVVSSTGIACNHPPLLPGPYCQGTTCSSLMESALNDWLYFLHELISFPSPLISFRPQLRKFSERSCEYHRLSANYF